MKKFLRSSALSFILILPAISFGQELNNEDQAITASQWKSGEYDRYMRRSPSSPKLYEQGTREIEIIKNRSGRAIELIVDGQRYNRSGDQESSYSAYFENIMVGESLRFLENSIVIFTESYSYDGYMILGCYGDLIDFSDEEFTKHMESARNAQSEEHTDEFASRSVIGESIESVDIKLITEQELVSGTEFQIGVTTTLTNGTILKSENLDGLQLPDDYLIRVEGASFIRNIWTIDYCDIEKSSELVITVFCKEEDKQDVAVKSVQYSCQRDPELVRAQLAESNDLKEHRQEVRGDQLWESDGSYEDEAIKKISIKLITTGAIDYNQEIEVGIEVVMADGSTQKTKNLGGTLSIAEFFIYLENCDYISLGKFKVRHRESDFDVQNTEIRKSKDFRTTRKPLVLATAEFIYNSSVKAERTIHFNNTATYYAKDLWRIYRENDQFDLPDERCPVDVIITDMTLANGDPGYNFKLKYNAGKDQSVVWPGQIDVNGNHYSNVTRSPQGLLNILVFHPDDINIINKTDDDNVSNNVRYTVYKPDHRELGDISSTKTPSTSNANEYTIMNNTGRKLTVALSSSGFFRTIEPGKSETVNCRDDVMNTTLSNTTRRIGTTKLVIGKSACGKTISID
ncbi:MAG: hypothetical protein ACI837_001727 [Crocinitomicaceae bacterium]|jgi:hypothetical protein